MATSNSTVRIQIQKELLRLDGKFAVLIGGKDIYVLNEQREVIKVAKNLRAILGFLLQIPYQN